MRLNSSVPRLILENMVAELGSFGGDRIIGDVACEAGAQCKKILKMTYFMFNHTSTAIYNINSIIHISETSDVTRETKSPFSS